MIPETISAARSAHETNAVPLSGYRDAGPHMAGPSAVEPAPSETDFDLHGFVGIRLLNASAGDAAAVGRQLGGIRKPLTRDPDIVLRFVDRPGPRAPAQSRIASGREPACLLGVNEAAFTEEEFLVLRSKHKRPTRVRLPLAEVGGRCEIVCQRGLSAVPLLVPIINLTALAKGYVPLHASAFVYEGRGIVATGWSKGGKTEALLAFLSQGASYVGDEWVYLSPDGGRVYGIPEPVTLWDWHLRQLPAVRRKVNRRSRARLLAVRLMTRLLRAAGRQAQAARLLRSIRAAQGAARLIDRALPLLERQLSVNLPPERIIGDGPPGTEPGGLAPDGWLGSERRDAPSAGSPGAPLDTVLFVASRQSPEFLARPVSGREVAERMVFSLREERTPLTACYHKYRFAFPRRVNPLLEQASEIERHALRRILADKEAYAVYHPYPCSIAKLFETVAEVLRRDE